jgi:molybdopterin converting factor small subunit
VAVTFHIPGPLQRFSDGRSEVRMDSAPRTLREGLDLLGTLYPGLRDRILTEQGDLREHVNIFVGNEDARHTGSLTTPLPADAQITILPAISGGGDRETLG